MAPVSETKESAGSQWIHNPTEEPLSPELRAAVVEDLKEEFYFQRTLEYNRRLKFSWLCEEYHQIIKDTNVSLGLQHLYRLCNVLVAFYWMPSPEVDGLPLPLAPFGCIYKEWFRYHNNHPSIVFSDFFAHLVRVYPTGPTTVQDVIAAHKSLCQEAVSLLGRIERGELTWCRDPQAYNLESTYHGIIIMMDQYLKPDFDPDMGRLLDLHEQAQKFTVMLVRTGNDSHLCAPINFDALRAEGLCLPLARFDVPPTSDDVVRVSIATAVKFVSDLHQREVDAHPPTGTLRYDKWEKSAEMSAIKKMEEADAKGIDNDYWTRDSVRRVMAERRGEIVEPREPYPFNRFWI